MSLMEPEQLQAVALAGGMRFSLWCKTIGISQRTGMRWRDAGKINVVARYGMQFVTATTIREFFEDDGSRFQNVRGIAALKSQQRRTRAATSHPSPAPA